MAPPRVGFSVAHAASSSSLGVFFFSGSIDACAWGASAAENHCNQKIYPKGMLASSLLGFRLIVGCMGNGKWKREDSRGNYRGRFQRFKVFPWEISPWESPAMKNDREPFRLGVKIEFPIKTTINHDYFARKMQMQCSPGPGSRLPAKGDCPLAAAPITFPDPIIHEAQHFLISRVEVEKKEGVKKLSKSPRWQGRRIFSSRRLGSIGCGCGGACPKVSPRFEGFSLDRDFQKSKNPNSIKNPHFLRSKLRRIFRPRIMLVSPKKKVNNWSGR